MGEKFISCEFAGHMLMFSEDNRADIYISRVRPEARYRSFTANTQRHPAIRNPVLLDWVISLIRLHVLPEPKHFHVELHEGRHRRPDALQRLSI